MKLLKGFCSNKLMCQLNNYQIAADDVIKSRDWAKATERSVSSPSPSKVISADTSGDGKYIEQCLSFVFSA